MRASDVGQRSDASHRDTKPRSTKSWRRRCPPVRWIVASSRLRSDEAIAPNYWDLRFSGDNGLKSSDRLTTAREGATLNEAWRRREVQLCGLRFLHLLAWS